MSVGTSSFRALAAVILTSVAVAGCSSYKWRPTVAEGFRTVSVPVFRNESNVQALGSTMSTQLLREFQREGTFKIRRVGDAALEIQGVVKSAGSGAAGYDRRSGLRLTSYNYGAVVVVSVIDKRNGRVLVDNKTYRAETTFTANQDISTAQRDSAGRLAEDLARQVVDDVTTLSMDFDEKEQ